MPYVTDQDGYGYAFHPQRTSQAAIDEMPASKRRSSRSQAALVDRFKAGAREGKASHMFIEGDVLYSYGHHFPLAVRMPDGQYLINGDKYSITTSQHTNMVLDLGPQVPFSALRAAEVMGTFEWRYWDEPIGGLSIVDHTKDKWETVPAPTKEDPNATREEHYLGGVVLGYKDKHYLSGLDQNEPWRMRSYFLCELPRKVTSYQDALEALKPDRVRDWEKEGRPAWKRQGEWFFLPYEDLKTRHLPRPSIKEARLGGEEGTHVVREARQNGRFYGRRMVTHQPGAWRRPQHKRLNLGTIWHETVKNTAVASWNADGNVD